MTQEKIAGVREDVERQPLPKAARIAAEAHSMIARGLRFSLCLALLILPALSARTWTQSAQITAAGQPARLDVRVAGPNSVRVTLAPLNIAEAPANPALADKRLNFVKRRRGRPRDQPGA